MSTLTDEVAALRAILARQASGLHRNGILARVDRIAAGVQELSTPVTRPDEVAELREKIDFNAYRSDEAHEIVALLDRLAAAVPVRATDTMGVPLWIHTCGTVTSGTDARADYCRECGVPGALQPLYTLGGA